MPATELGGALVAGIEDVIMIDQAERKTELREEEVVKLEEFGSFEVTERTDVPTPIQIYKHKWVDTAEKSRFTIADLKAYGEATGDTHCPTPSSVTNNVMEAIAAVKNYPMVIFDLVSASHMPKRNARTST